MSSATEFIGWDNTSVNVGGVQGGAGFYNLNFGSNSTIQADIPGALGNDIYSAADNKDIRIKWRCRVDTAPSAGQIIGFGITDPASNIYGLQTAVGNSIRFAINGNSVYAVNGDSVGNTNTDLTSVVTETLWNVYEIVFNPGVDARFYVNGILRATHTTNLPTGDVSLFAIGASEISTELEFSPITFSIQL